MIPEITDDVKNKISVTILTKDSSKHLFEVLTALKNFEEVLIYDNGSTDDTLAIAESFPNATAIKGSFIGFGPTHNIASATAKYDWILSVDSDEIVLEETVDEIFAASLDLNSVYSFPRRNFYNGKWIRWCGWHPDRQIRLYNRRYTQFTDAQVHEAIISKNMKVIKMQGAFKHYSYETVSDFIRKMQSYSDLFCKQYAGKKKSSLFTAITHGIFAFLKSFFLKKGFLGGIEGFIISAYNGHTAYYKYLKLHEANQTLQNKK